MRNLFEIDPNRQKSIDALAENFYGNVDDKLVDLMIRLRKAEAETDHEFHTGQNNNQSGGDQ